MIEAAVIGVGQTKYEAKRRDVSMGGLVRKAIDKAMLAADVDWDAIDAVILGKAPDMFEGCHDARAFTWLTQLEQMVNLY